MTLKDLQEKAQNVYRKLQEVAKCNPSLNLSRAFSYLKNVDDVLRNYESDDRAGRHQTLAGFWGMALFNFERAEAVLSDAIGLTLKSLKDAFFKKAHGRIEPGLIKAVISRADEVLQTEGLAPAKRLLERADYAFYLLDYDFRIKELRQLAGLPVLEVNTKKAPVSTVKFYRKPLAVKVESVAHKVTTPTTQPPEKTKVFTGRFVDPNASAVPMIDPSTPVLGMSTDLQRNRISQRQLASRSSARGTAVSGTGKAAIARRKGGKK